MPAAGIEIPGYLVRFARERGPAGDEWLARLPGLVGELVARWELDLDDPFGDPPAAAAWIAPGRRQDGTEIVLKLAWPHAEAATEAAGLRCFAGHGGVRLFAWDEGEHALLLERVRPGDDLWTLEVDAANEVAARVLDRLWRPPPPDSGIGTLADTIESWNRTYERTRRRYPRELVRRAVDESVALVATQPEVVVLHGDFNPFNVLRSEEGWVVIDPKPILGERAHDLAQYLHNRADAARAAPDPATELRRQVDALSTALGLDSDRVARWASVKAVGWDWGPDDAALFADVVARG